MLKYKLSCGCDVITFVTQFLVDHFILNIELLICIMIFFYFFGIKAYIFDV